MIGAEENRALAEGVAMLTAIRSGDVDEGTEIARTSENPVLIACCLAGLLAGILDNLDEDGVDVGVMIQEVGLSAARNGA